MSTARDGGRSGSSRSLDFSTASRTRRQLLDFPPDELNKPQCRNRFGLGLLRTRPFGGLSSNTCGIFGGTSPGGAERARGSLLPLRASCWF